MDRAAVKGVINEAVSTGFHSSPELKAAAKKAAADLPDAPYAYNGYLMLDARGAPLTEANIVAESKKLATANEQHFADQRKRRDQPPAGAGAGE